MNKLQALLIAGLLSLTSVSFASSVTFVNSGNLGNSEDDAGAVLDGAKAGTIYLDNFGGTAVFGGDLANSTESATTSAYYDVVLDNSFEGLNTFAFGWARNTAFPNDLTVSFFDENGNTFNAAYEGLFDPTGAGNFIVQLAANTTYRMLLTGAEGWHYDGEISAVPVPAAGILFASALFGAGALGRRKKKAKASVVGAFARAS